MKILPFVLLAAVLLLMGDALGAETPTYDVPVRVNGRPIVSSEVREAIRTQEEFIRMQIGDPRAAEKSILQVRAGALFHLMEQELVLSEFQQARGVLKPQFVEDDINQLIRARFGGDRKKFLQELANAGMTLPGFREQREKMLIVASLRIQRVKDLPPPTPAQVEAYYRKNEEKFRETGAIKFSTITIPKYPVGDAVATPESQKKLAEDIRMKVAGGSDFAQMAKTHSTDRYAKAGGDRGLQKRDALSVEIGDAAFALKPGAVSGVVEIRAEYLIVYCEARQPGKLTPLDEIRPQVEQLVVNEMSRQVTNQWLSGLASKAVIQPENVKGDFLRWLDQQEAFVE